MKLSEITWSFIYEDHNADLFPFYFWLDWHVQNPALKNSIQETLGVFTDGKVEYWVDKQNYLNIAHEIYKRIVDGQYFENSEKNTQ